MPSKNSRVMKADERKTLRFLNKRRVILVTLLVAGGLVWFVRRDMEEVIGKGETVAIILDILVKDF